MTDADETVPYFLVIDDDPDMQDVLREVFRYAGYHACIANNAEQVIHILETGDTLPRLIISDVLMPRMDGYQLMDMIHQNTLWQHIPFLFISGQEATTFVDQPTDTRVIGYLSKPFPINDLLTVIKQVLNGV